MPAREKKPAWATVAVGRRVLRLTMPRWLASGRAPARTIGAGSTSSAGIYGRSRAAGRASGRWAPGPTVIAALRSLTLGECVLSQRSSPVTSAATTSQPMTTNPRRDRWVSELEAEAVARFREKANLHDSSADWDLVVFAHGAGEDLPGAAEVRAAYREALAEKGPGG